MGLRRTITLLCVFAVFSYLDALSPASALEPSKVLKAHYRGHSFEEPWRPIRLGATPSVVPEELPSPPPLVLSSPAKAAKIKGNPGTWVTGRDYPPAAFKRREQGVARFVLSIDASGKPSGCVIMASTGSNDLDVATCSLVMRRAEFLPARDEFDRVMSGSYSGAVRWILPVDRIRHADLAVPLRVSKYQAELDASGQIIGCRVEFIGSESATAVIFAGREICEQRFQPQ